MSSEYAREYAIPDGFADILKDFTREVLRDQPADINEYAYQYFTNQRDAGGGGGGGGLAAMTPEQLQEMIAEMFLEADADNSGYLDRKEFKNVFRMLADRLDLGAQDIRRLMAEADEDGNGRIEYREFVPLAVEVIEAIVAKGAAKREQEDALAAADDFLMHGLSRAEVEELMGQIFTKADADGSGVLSRQEFCNALRDADLGLSRKEVNVLLAEVDDNNDGSVSYAEFVPLCYNILKEVLADDFRNENMPAKRADCELFFTDLFRSADLENTGLLHYQDVMDLVVQADLGLTRIQVHALMSESQANDDGEVQYERFASTVSGMITAMCSFEERQAMALKTQAFQASDAYTTQCGMDRDAFEQSLRKALDDADGAGAGALARADISQAIAGALGALSVKQLASLLSLAAPADGGLFAYGNVVTYGFSVLQEIGLHAS